MSGTVLKVIPTDPRWQPSRFKAVRQAFVARVPKGAEVDAVVLDGVQLVDCGLNLQTVACDVCGAEVDGDWWQEAMDAAWGRKSFEDLAITTPCGHETSLATLAYDGPMGFASFVLEAEDVPELSDDDLTGIAKVAGTPLRQFTARY